MTAVIAYVTCAAIAELEPDDLLTVEPLAALGIKVEPAIWDDPGVDWDRYDLAVLRSAWDYTPRRDEFVAWAHTVPRLANDAVTVGWNTDKRYLAELAAAGISIVPTTWVEPGGPAWTAPAGGEWVIKPAISAGSRDTGRYDAADAEQRALAEAHVIRLTGAGRIVMIQPYLPAVDTHGETALIYIGGVFSHAIRKGPLLTPGADPHDDVFAAEDITAREPSDDERTVAERVVGHVRGRFGDLAYVRVDLVRGGDGPRLLELELTEPSLFFLQCPGAAERFAAAIRRRA
jgi:glutathione synthase/RimK-type ligase-like ATP-grasp enzyme